MGIELNPLQRKTLTAIVDTFVAAVPRAQPVAGDGNDGACQVSQTAAPPGCCKPFARHDGAQSDGIVPAGAVQ